MSKRVPSKRQNEYDEEVRKIVVARLSVLSPDTYVSIGSDGSFSRDELIARVQAGDEVGKKMEEIQMEWLRSWKKRAAIV